jgi:hypothetical protein
VAGGDPLGSRYSRNNVGKAEGFLSRGRNKGRNIFAGGRSKLAEEFWFLCIPLETEEPKDSLVTNSGDAGAGAEKGGAIR